MDAQAFSRRINYRLRKILNDEKDTAYYNEEAAALSKAVIKMAEEASIGIMPKFGLDTKGLLLPFKAKVAVIFEAKALPPEIKERVIEAMTFVI